jgi:U5 small nuclear ribonucleoprotein component
MDGADHYDEYGNYIGPALDTSSDEDSDADLSMGGLQSDAAADEGGAAASAFANDLLQRDDIDGPVVRMDLTVVDSDALAQRAPPPGAYGVGSNAIVLAEDKQYYPDASQVYGDGVETLVEEEDAQPLSVPIVAPVKRRKTTVLEEDVVPETTYSTAFMAGMLAHPRLARNVGVVGQIHGGKTTLLDLLVEQTHVSFEQTWPLDKERRWTDTRVDEQARGMSIKSSPVSLVLPTSTGKSYLLNLMDCPGHANFSAETTAAIRVSDGCVVVLDACEGIMMHTEQAIREAVANEVPVCLVVSKMDRLITELKLPPNDAYYKLRYMIGRVNEIISESFAGYQNLQVMRSQSRNGESTASKSVRGPPLVSPELGNVCFASGRDRWCFSLESSVPSVL